MLLVLTPNHALASLLHHVAAPSSAPGSSPSPLQRRCASFSRFSKTVRTFSMKVLTPKMSFSFLNHILMVRTVRTVKHASISMASVCAPVDGLAQTWAQYGAKLFENRENMSRCCDSTKASSRPQSSGAFDMLSVVLFELME